MTRIIVPKIETHGTRIIVDEKNSTYQNYPIKNDYCQCDEICPHCKKKKKSKIGLI